MEIVRARLARVGGEIKTSLKMRRHMSVRSQCNCERDARFAKQIELHPQQELYIFTNPWQTSRVKKWDEQKTGQPIRLSRRG